MPVARILFPLPLPEPFDYAVPEGLDVREGSYVAAPLGKYERLGVVLELLPNSAAEGRKLKEVSDVYPTPPMTAAMRDFIHWAARYTVSHPGHVLGMALRSRGGLTPSPTETVYHLTGVAPPRITEARTKLIEAVKELGPQTASTLAEAAGDLLLGSAVTGHGMLSVSRESADRGYGATRELRAHRPRVPPAVGRGGRNRASARDDARGRAGTDESKRRNTFLTVCTRPRLSTQTRRRLGGRQPLWGIGVVSRIERTSRPAMASARMAPSRPEPGPFT